MKTIAPVLLVLLLSSAASAQPRVHGFFFRPPSTLSMLYNPDEAQTANRVIAQSTETALPEGRSAAGSARPAR